MQRWVLHVDMDAFYAAVEQRDRPECRNRPVIVGGLGNRGVVSTASYEARRFGVHSAMPMVTARRLCPQAVFLPCDHEKYSAVSSRIMQLLGEFSPLVEPVSVDEAFLDISGMERLFAEVSELAATIKRRIRAEVALTASVGVAPNKFLAKMASDMKKPDGLVVVSPGAEAEFLRNVPVGKLWGIGEVTAKQLEAKGIVTIGQLALAAETVLAGLFGRQADMVRALALGRDERLVVPVHEAKSVGAEETFEHDLRQREELQACLMQLAERVGFRLRGNRLAGRTVTLKLRYGSFQTLTRRRTLAEPVQTDEGIYRVAVELLSGQTNLDTGVRLLGVTVSQLEPEQGIMRSLFGEQEEKLRRLSGAADRIRQKYGAGTIVHACLAQRKERNDTET